LPLGLASTEVLGRGLGAGHRDVGGAATVAALVGTTRPAVKRCDTTRREGAKNERVATDCLRTERQTRDEPLTVLTNAVLVRASTEVPDCPARPGAGLDLQARRSLQGSWRRRARCKSHGVQALWHATARGPRTTCFPRPNVRGKRATAAGRQARAGDNVPRTTGPGLVACRWRSA
jgi:hypothetical protein